MDIKTFFSLLQQKCVEKMFGFVPGIELVLSSKRDELPIHFANGGE